MEEHDVTYEHPAFEEFKERAELVDDVVQNRVKKKGKKYLPELNPIDKSPENIARNKQYLERAYFHNATGYTRRGLLGAAFLKPPVCETQPALDYIKTDVDGEGNSITQQSRSTLGHVLAKGRHGLLVDYPTTEGSQTRAEQQATNTRATIASIDGKNIINWRTRKIGADYVLDLVVYRDDQMVPTADGFGCEKVESYRVLELDELNNYTQELYQKNAEGEWVGGGAVSMLRGNGQPWDRIPFIFVGSENNDTAVDMSPLYDMAVVNIGHYRNTADLEHSGFFCGQVQPWASGLTEGWVELMEKRSGGLVIGSPVLLPLPEGASFGFAQAEPNTLAGELQKRKEEQMIQLGARLLEKGGAVKTATQETNENMEEHSVLSLAAENVSQAYQQCLEWMQVFNNTNTQASYQISQEFTRPTLDANMLTALVGAFQSGTYTKSDLWDQYRKYGLVDPEKTDEEIEEELDSDPTGLGLEE